MTSEDETTVTFLLQDQDGAYFWVEGNGDTVMEAFENAAESYKMPFEKSKSSYGEGIKSLFGLEMTQIDSVWYWWSQYQWTNSTWTSASVTMDELDAKENPYFACVYGNGAAGPKVTPSDAAVWDKDTRGTVFTIKCPSGMYFNINGSGNNLEKCAVNACETYKVPYALTDSKGIDVCGIESYTNYTETGMNGAYWAQKYVDDKGVEQYTPSYMENLTSQDYPAIIFDYETWSYSF